ncbi:aldo/keto reductase [Coprobacillus cateniformis]|nr:aldo/keto reductase [Coprobacillus cateniformis]
MKYVKLNNGVKMPMLGFGVCRIDDLKECEEVVLNAIQEGYRLIDTAAIYGNEIAVGNAIMRSHINREEFFITSKLWIDDNSYEGAKKAFQDSLKKLQLDYIDLYLIHRPIGDYYGAYKALSELYKEGKIKAIGVSNFYIEQLMDLILFQEVKPVVNQIQCHPFQQRKEELHFLKENDIQLEAWSPFAVGQNHIFQNEILTMIAKKYDKSVAQIILRWHIQRGIVVIPKSVQRDRMKENMDIWNFQLSKEDMKLINQLDLSQNSTDDRKRLESLLRAVQLTKKASRDA